MRMDAAASLSTLDMKLPSMQGKDKKEQLEEVATQFEAIFLNMALKEMRKSEEAFSSDLFSSHEEKTYREMLDQQLSLDLASKQGIGLKEALVSQLDPELRNK